MMKKSDLFPTVAGIALLLLALGGFCGKIPFPSSVSSAETPDDGSYVVGICRMASPDTPDAVIQGFRDALTEALGDTVSFIESTAADPAACADICGQFVSSDVDLILAATSPALRSAVAATADIPILGTCIADYGTALGLESFSGLIGTNVSGTSTLVPPERLSAMIREWCPDAKTVGLLYSAQNAASRHQADALQQCLEPMGVLCIHYPFDDPSLITVTTQKAVLHTDALYIPAGDAAASYPDVIDNVCRPIEVPVFAADEALFAGCGAGMLSPDCYNLGVVTGRMAAEILSGKALIREMPIAYASVFAGTYNPEICRDLSLSVPAGYAPMNGRSD